MLFSMTSKTLDIRCYSFNRIVNATHVSIINLDYSFFFSKEIICSCSPTIPHTRRSTTILIPPSENK